MHLVSTLIDIPALDAEHQFLFETIDSLQKAARESDDLSIRFLLEAAASHAVEHFAHEEQLMREAGYAGYEWHRRQHAAALKQIGSLLSSARRKADATGLLAYLSEWLPRHISLHDRMMAAALRNAHHARTCGYHQRSSRHAGMSRRSSFAHNGRSARLGK